jgi:hypothetical protein
MTNILGVALPSWSSGDAPVNLEHKLLHRMAEFLPSHDEVKLA